jgi:hypothetical protein
MANEPLRRTPPRPVPPPSDRPKIWAEGDQRPPFSFRGLRRATLYLARDGVAPLNAWMARTARRVAVNVANGAGRIPEGKLGRAARFVPSHLRVAAWIKNSAAVFAHASAVADIDVKRGNALVSEIEPHLWPTDASDTLGEPPPLPPESAQVPPVAAGHVDPVVLAEPVGVEADPASNPEADPLAATRDDLGAAPEPGRRARAKAGASRTPAPSAAALPPKPPGPLTVTAIQVSGYLVGWSAVIIALPYGMVRALWGWGARNVDLRHVGLDD